MSRIKNGLKKAYYAVMTAEGTYSAVKELGELIEINVQASENTTSLYAGNRIYSSTNSLGEVNVTFTLPEISDENFKALFGYEASTTYGGIVRTNSTDRPYIAIMFEQTGEGFTDYITLYKGKLGLPSIEGKTTESGVQYNTLSFSGTFMPNEDGVWCFTVASDDPKYTSSNFATKWGKEVVLPNATPAA